LGFDKYWEYPKSEEPLLWNIGRKYYYFGEMVAEVRGGNIFEDPKILFTDKGKDLKLKPIDLKGMIEKNIEPLKVLENEAIDFINDVYKKYKSFHENLLVVHYSKYKEKVDYFIVSYSGGKDSQVVLDLVSKTLPPDEYIVIFTDTTMEIPPTYEVYEKTKEYYQKLYPNLKFLYSKK